MRGNNKLKRIIEANIKLENRFLLREQAAPAPAPAPAPVVSQTTTVQAAQPQTTTTTTFKKLTDEELGKLDSCSKFNSKKEGLSQGEDKGKFIVFNKNGKPFCKKTKEGV